MSRIWAKIGFFAAVPLMWHCSSPRSPLEDEQNQQQNQNDDEVPERPEFPTPTDEGPTPEEGPGTPIENPDDAIEAYECQILMEQDPGEFFTSPQVIPYGTGFRFKLVTEDVELPYLEQEDTPITSWKYTRQPDISNGIMTPGYDQNYGYALFIEDRLGVDAIGSYEIEATIDDGIGRGTCTFEVTMEAPPGLYYELLWDGPGAGNLHVSQWVLDEDGSLGGGSAGHVWCNNALPNESQCESQECIDTVRAMWEETVTVDCGYVTGDCSPQFCGNSFECADWNGNDTCDPADPTVRIDSGYAYGPDGIWIEQPLPGLNTVAGVYHFPLPPFPGTPLPEKINYTLRLWLNNSLIVSESDSVDFGWFGDAMRVEIKRNGLLGGYKLEYQTLQTGKFGSVPF